MKSKKKKLHLEVEVICQLDDVLILYSCFLWVLSGKKHNFPDVYWQEMVSSIDFVPPLKKKKTNDLEGNQSTLDINKGTLENVIV